MEQSISDKNKIIAEFMGLHPNKHDGCRTFAKELFVDDNDDQWAYEWIYPDYHENWSSLMPVVEKIMAFEFEDGDTAYIRTFGMQKDGSNDKMVRFNRSQLFFASTLIEATYIAVLDFINYHNQNKQP